MGSSGSQRRIGLNRFEGKQIEVLNAGNKNPHEACPVRIFMISRWTNQANTYGPSSPTQVYPK